MDTELAFIDPNNRLFETDFSVFENFDY